MENFKWLLNYMYVQIVYIECGFHYYMVRPLSMFIFEIFLSLCVFHFTMCNMMGKNVSKFLSTYFFLSEVTIIIIFSIYIQ